MGCRETECCVSLYTCAGAAPIASGYTQTPPQREGHVHHAEATTNHCFVTVDLDLNNGYVRFFRNGHLIGTAFQNVTGPVCPVLSLLQVCFDIPLAPLPYLGTTARTVQTCLGRLRVGIQVQDGDERCEEG